MADKPEMVIEAALFSSTKALSVGDLMDITGLTEDDVRSGLKELTGHYHKRQSSIEIAKVGANYTMMLRKEYAHLGEKLSPKQVPAALLKTLALIAYYQPIKQSDLKTMIGDKVYEQVKELRRLNMISAMRRGPTKILVTSKYFPEYFGIGVGTRAGIKKWIAEKVGVKIYKGKIAVEEYEDTEEDRAGGGGIGIDIIGNGETPPPSEDGPSDDDAEPEYEENNVVHEHVEEDREDEEDGTEGQAEEDPPDPEMEVQKMANFVAEVAGKEEKKTKRRGGKRKKR